MSLISNAPSELLDELLGRTRNQAALTTAKRPQGYVSRETIAGGDDKARYKGFRDIREHWGAELVQRGWVDAIRGLDLNPKEHSRYGPAIAFINHGRWMALCPDPDCAGAEVVTSSDRVFMCLSCGNIENKGRLYPVKFPTELKEISRQLSKRPRIYRNWHPHETVEDLARENEENL